MLANFSNLITFSRGSNATVTDASGRLTYAPHNLLTNSETFEATAWTKTGVSVTANVVVAPNGSTTADLMAADGTTGDHRVLGTGSPSTGTTYLISVYAKQGPGSYLLAFNGFGTAANIGDFPVFNLQNGTVVTAGTLWAETTIEPVGDGWYRCSSRTTAASTTSLYLSLMTDASTRTFTGTVGNGLYLWGAQLEAVTYQTTPSPYVSTSVANLIGFSEDFANAAWAKTRASIVPNAAQNPINGLWNAQKFMEDTTASNSHFMFQTATVVANTRYVQSVYAKAGERNWMWMTEANNVTAQAYFDLANGVVGTVSGTGSPTAAITPVGNGWYRCSLAFTPIASAANVQVRLANGNGSGTYTGDGNSGIYIYGAQLSNSGSLDPYVPTPGAAPSSTAYYGPRFDYDPVTLAAKGILIEEQRVNRTLYSDNFTGAAWLAAVSGTSTRVNDGAPLGFTRGLITATSALGGIRQVHGSLTSGQVYALSFYIQSTSTSVQIVFENGIAQFGSLHYVTINPSNGTAGVLTGFTSVSVQPFGPGYIYTLITAPAGGALSANIEWRITNNGDSIWLGRPQFEAGAFATSYIPTVASQVTRLSDNAQITGSLFSQWFNGLEGTLVTGFVPTLTVANNTRAATLTDGTSRIVDIYVDVNAWRTFNGVTNVSPSGNTAVLGANVKFATAYKAGDYAAAMNGGTAGTANTASVGTATRLGIGVNFTSAVFLNGHIQNITYYPTRLTNDQLQAITK